MPLSQTPRTESTPVDGNSLDCIQCILIFNSIWLTDSICFSEYAAHVFMGPYICVNFMIPLAVFVIVFCCCCFWPWSVATLFNAIVSRRLLLLSFRWLRLSLYHFCFCLLLANRKPVEHLLKPTVHLEKLYYVWVDFKFLVSIICILFEQKRVYLTFLFDMFIIDLYK